jgi:cytochrome P450
MSTGFDDLICRKIQYLLQFTAKSSCLHQFKLLLADFKGDILVAQAAIFFTAGFEANAAIISFTFYELAMQPYIQTRLREEILDVVDKNEGKLTYEAIRDMEYLHMVVSGT